MVSLATSQLSSKGQVVIPQEIRDRLGLKSGAKFVVVADRGVVILKIIEMPDLRDVDHLVREARRQAKKAGMKRSDLDAAIRKARAAR